jgi:tape measure domain-containing protein
MNNAEVLVKFTGDTSKLDKSTKEATSTITNLAKSVTLGALATKGITKAIEVFNSGLDGAIARADTMNNFPKVMSNLGISAEDASEIVKDLSEKLRGLPTSLDRATNSVQRLTTKTGDVKEAEKIFLALNNAIIAGGASSDIQASAMEQISQAFSKGKPDMMEWRTMMMAMPAQLKQVADAMGYVNVADLGTAIREDGGEKEFSRMIETMVKMNTIGVGSFKSFEEQAKNATGGISVSATNMRTAIVRGISNMLNAVNQATQQFGGISGILSSIGKFGEQVFTKLGEAMSYIIPKLYEIYSWYKKHELLIYTIAIAVGTMVITFKTLRTVISIIKAVKTAIALLNAVMLANPIVLIIGAIAGLVAGFIYLWNNCEAFKQFWINLWETIQIGFYNAIEFIKGLINNVILFIQNIPTFISNIVNGIISFLNKIPYYLGYLIGFCIGKIYLFFTETIPNAVNAFIEFLLSIPGKIWDIITTIFSLISRIPGYLNDLWNKLKLWFTNLRDRATNGFRNLIDNIVNWFRELPGKMSDIGKNIVEGLWNGIRNMTDWMKRKIADFANGILNGIREALGIHSPSKEFAIVGRYSVLGYTEALDDMSAEVDRQIQDTFGLSPNLTNSASLHYSPNVVVNNNVDISQDPLGQMVSSIKSYSGGAKNDYNFGLGN